MLNCADGLTSYLPHSHFQPIVVSLWLAGCPVKSFLIGWRQCVHISWRMRGRCRHTPVWWIVVILRRTCYLCLFGTIHSALCRKNHAIEISSARKLYKAIHPPDTLVICHLINHSLNIWITGFENDQMAARCWPTVYDAGPTSSHHWVIIPAILITHLCS